MTKDDKDIVSAVQRALAGRVGTNRYELWIGDDVQFAVVDSVLCISAPSQFRLDQLRNRLRHDIQAALATVSGAPREISFQVQSVPDESTSEPTSEPTSELGSTVPFATHRGDPRDPQARPSRNASEASRDAAAGDVSAGGRHTSTRPRAAARDASPQPYRSEKQLREFVAGESNRLALSAARMVIRQPGQASPLFIYGPNGCGKTHLLESIRAACRKRGMRRIVSLSAEQFTGLFLEALQGSGLPSFRRKYRDVELLLIDDVQFFAGKRATLTEVLHTLDTLTRAGRQIVLTADRAPNQLSQLGTELINRMSGGLVCPLEPLDQATRRRVLEQFAAAHQQKLQPDVLDYIAEHIQGDARQLRGAVNRIIATSEALQTTIDADLAASALSDLVQCAQPLVRLPDIEHAVCDVFGLDPSSLQSQRKARAISHPRMLAMWLARKYTRAAYSEIGTFFGRRSHSTVISAHKTVERWMEEDVAISLAQGSCHVKDAIRRIEASLRTG